MDGVLNMAKSGVIIKNLSSIESLGRVSVICSDKTGTITKNEMTITKIFADDKVIDISGSGYKPEGNFYCDKTPVNPKEVRLLLDIGYMCNNAKVPDMIYRIGHAGKMNYKDS